jgi:hypothetical protein
VDDLAASVAHRIQGAWGSGISGAPVTKKPGKR